MIDFTFQELACIDAVVSAGNFHATAAQLNRSHPAVYAAVKELESRLVCLCLIDLFSVTLVPVVAPGFLPFPITAQLTPRQMKGQVQCLIRDSAKKPVRDYNVNKIKGARSWTVGNQLMKKELILLGMG